MDILIMFGILAFIPSIILGVIISERPVEFGGF